VSERPTAAELVEAVLEFLGREILPVVEDQRLRFRTLVAMNALSIVYRELLERLPAEDDAEQRELAARIREGDVPPGTLARVERDVRARLLVASPRYLESYD
jgi:signal transduction protein with GAF and PtsI domain